MNEALLFAGREARRQALPKDMVNALQSSLAQAGNNDPAFMESQIDRQVSAQWFANKLGLSRGAVAKNLDAVSEKYFGRKMDASAVYDEITKREQHNVRQYYRALSNAPAVEGEEGQDDAEAQAFKYSVTARDVGRGFASSMAQEGYKMLGGTFGIIAGALESVSPEVKRKSLLNDKEWLDAAQRLAAIEMSGDQISKEDADELTATMRKRSKEIDYANRVEEMSRADSWFDAYKPGVYADVAKDWAKSAYGMADEMDRLYDVSPEFRETTVGKVVGVAGATVPSFALAGVGRVAQLGGKAMFGAYLSQTYGAVESERMAREGDDYRFGGATFASNMVNAGGQAILEQAIRLDNVFERVIGGANTVRGRVRIGDFLRETGKEFLRTGAGEAVEEVAQQTWDDVVSTLVYQNNVNDADWTPTEVAKRMAVSAIGGLLAGGAMGSTFKGADILDAVRARKQAQKVLTFKDGDTVTAQDLPLIRAAYSRDEVAVMPFGELLNKAIDGDMAAGDAYNQAALKAKFVSTDGMTAFGGQLGIVESKPAFMTEAGEVVTFDTANPDDVARFEMLKRASVEQSAASEVLKMFQEQLGDRLTVDIRDRITLAEMVASGKISEEEARGFVEVAVAVGQIRSDATYEEITIAGSGFAYKKGDEVKEMIRLTTDPRPLVVIEEKAHAGLDWLVKSGHVTHDYVTQLRNEWDLTTGQISKEVSQGNVERLNQEWFAQRVTEYALANRKTMLTQSWGRWLSGVARYLGEILRGAMRMKNLIRRGQVNPDLVRLMESSLKGVEYKGKPAPEPVQPITSNPITDSEYYALTPQQQQTLQSLIGPVRHRMLMSSGFQTEARAQAQTYQERLTEAAKARYSSELPFLNQWGLTIDSQIRELSPKLWSKFTKLDQRYSALRQKWLTPFKDISASLEALSKQDEATAKLFALSVGNGDMEAARAIAKTMGFEPEFDACLAVIEESADMLLEAGETFTKFYDAPAGFFDDEVRVQNLMQSVDAAVKGADRGDVAAAVKSVILPAGFVRKAYWPRKVFDRDGLREWLGARPDHPMQAVLKIIDEAQAQGRPLSQAEEEAIMSMSNNALLLNFNRGISTPGALKARSIPTLDIELLRYYYTPAEAAGLSLSGVLDYLQARDLFGKFASYETGARYDIASGLDVEASAGAMLLEEYRQGLGDAEVQRLRSLLAARFAKAGRPWAFFKTLQSLGSIQGLGQIYSGITATVQDLYFASYETRHRLGLMAKSFYQAVKKNNKFAADVMGIESDKLLVEMQTSVAPTVLGKVDRFLSHTLARSVFRINGFDFFNRLVRQTTVNAIVQDMQDRAKAQDFTLEQERRLLDLFGDAATQVKADLASGKVTPDVVLYSWATLGHWSVVSKSQHSVAYQLNPNARIFYQFKKFLVAFISGVRTSALNDMMEGARRQDYRLLAGGFRRLMSLMFATLLFGGATDMFRLLVTGRQIVLSDLVAGRMISFFGLSPYFYRTAARDGVDKAVASYVLPSGGTFIHNLTHDVKQAMAIWETGADVSLFEFLQHARTWETAPIFGRIYSEWVGNRSDKNVVLSDEESPVFVLTVEKDEDARAEARKDTAKRKRLEKEYGE